MLDAISIYKSRRKNGRQSDRSGRISFEDSLAIYSSIRKKKKKKKNKIKFVSKEKISNPSGVCLYKENSLRKTSHRFERPPWRYVSANVRIRLFSEATDSCEINRDIYHVVHHNLHRYLTATSKRKHFLYSHEF